MSESAQSLLIFFAIASIVSVAWHVFVKVYGVAILGATVTTVVAFQVFAYIQMGYLDPFFVFAIATSTAMAFAVAAIIGLPFRAGRKRSGPTRHAL